VSARPEAYTAPAAALHWIVAALVLVAVPLGAVLHDLPREPGSIPYYTAHKTLGALIGLFTVARLMWRWRHPPPAWEAGLPLWQRIAAHGVHGLLYALLVAVPVVGWLGSQAGGHPLMLFGVLPLPAPVPRSEALNEALHTVHSLLAWSLVTLVALHLLAVVKHQWIDRDGTLARMTAGLRRRSEPTRRGG
jgi:cytochrome b561